MSMDAEYIKAQFAKISKKGQKFLATPENQGATPGILPEKEYVPKGGTHGKRPKKTYPKGEKAPGWRNIHHKKMREHVED